jgi:hypothetical protein
MGFMSVEVQSKAFLFPPPPPRPSPPLDFAEIFRELEANRVPEISIVPFVHNHLHDLESLWWVAVWLVFYNEFHVTPQSNEVVSGNLLHVQRQICLAQTLFPSTPRGMSRQIAFQHSFQERCQGLPSSKKEICSYLNALRRILILGYTKVEATLPNSIDLMASKDNIYECFKEAFTSLQEQEFSLVYIPSVYDELNRR